MGCSSYCLCLLESVQEQPHVRVERSLSDHQDQRLRDQDLQMSISFFSRTIAAQGLAVKLRVTDRLCWRELT
jgi:hypothetical protein